MLRKYEKHFIPWEICQRVKILIQWIECYFSLGGWQSVMDSAADAAHASRLSTAVIQSAWREFDPLSPHVRDRGSIKCVMTYLEFSSQNRWLEQLW